MMTTMYGSGSQRLRGHARLRCIRAEQRIEQRLAGVVGVLDLLVEAGEVAHADRGHQLVAALHLGDAPAQRVGGFLHVGDDRREQVRDALVDGQLQHLRVDHDHAHVARAGLVEQAQHHRVQRDRLAGTGGAGDQQVRHLLQVDHDRRAADVLAERERERRLQRVVLARAQDLGEIDDLAMRVRNLEADHRLARNHVDHAHADHGQAARDVLVEAGNLAALDARRRLHLEARDDRARMRADHLRVDAEILELEFDLARQGFERFLGIALGLRLRLVEQRQRRQFAFVRCAGEQRNLRLALRRARFSRSARVSVRS